jgi:hypothetical protein
MPGIVGVVGAAERGVIALFDRMCRVAERQPAARVARRRPPDGITSASE